ncbi:MAG: hypothetical protein ACKOZT_04035 [Cyanobium sp.]
MDLLHRAATRSARLPRRGAGGFGLSLPLLLLSLSAVSGPLLAMPSAACAAPLPYPEAVTQGRSAARAVLAGAGRESCLRGKLTRALLLLSESCSAVRQTGPLCELADRAVVVTPMSLAFMRETAGRLLALSPSGS